MAIGKGSVIVDRELKLHFIYNHFTECQWFLLSMISQWPLANYTLARTIDDKSMTVGKRAMIVGTELGWLNVHSWGMILFVIQNIA